jgi:hypothetical protein
MSKDTSGVAIEGVHAPGSVTPTCVLLLRQPLVLSMEAKIVCAGPP